MPGSEYSRSIEVRRARFGRSAVLEKGMSNKARHLARTVKRMRPMAPAKDLELSKRFYM